VSGSNEQPAGGPFGRLLRELRLKARLSQEELAERAALSTRTIRSLERNQAHRPYRRSAQLLADALRLTGPARDEFLAAARGPAPDLVSWAAGGSAPTPGAATRTLPRDIASFTGRQQELARVADASADVGGIIGIQAIGGMAGVGKTAFAVHAAHQLAPRFPDGQLFVPLHGHTPGHRPVDPSDALASLLATTGVAPAQIPEGLQARAGLWRDRLTGKRVLLMLDDAVGSEQVRPLLPSAAGSLVLVTSRRHLTALEDAQVISLDLLSLAEAAALLVKLAARPGLAPGDATVAEICELCGYLPLAIGMVARQLHHHPAWSPAGLAAELAASRDRLELMTTENLSVAAGFDLSYADLTGDQQRLFRRLGLHPGSGIDTYAVAALDDCPLGAARRHLQALYDHYLLTEPESGRYRPHDLIREHAHALAARDDPASDRDQALDRLLDYYIHTATFAETRLARQTRPGPPPDLTWAPAAVPDLPDSAAALTWARAERTNLLACLDRVTASGQHSRVVDLTAALATLLRHDGPWTDAMKRHVTAARAAQESGDLLGRADALNNLGAVHRLTGDYAAAAKALAEALDIYRDLGNRLGQANALYNLGIVYRVTGDYQDATRDLAEALDIYRDLGDLLGQASALNNLGAVWYLTDAYPHAAQALEEALSIALELGDLIGQASALNDLGCMRRLAGDYPGAVAAQEAALAISRDLGNRLGQANALNELGSVLCLIDDYRGAVRALEEALSISRELGDRLGEANALNYLGAARRLAGDYPGAAQALEQALGMYRDLGNRGGEVEALNETGTLDRLRGNPGRAQVWHRQALELAQEIESSWDEAHALAGLGRCALTAGRRAEASAFLAQAQEIFQRICAPEASTVASELENLR
jgi:tetratricopeptide (TPR) repeat protein/transcriptional regulator with XRE-family HTH domain